MKDRKEKQRRRGISKLRKKLQAQIATAGDSAALADLQRKLRNLEERWALGLNSRSAKVIMREPIPRTYYFSK